MPTDLSRCIAGQHELTEIFRVYEDPTSEQVVRWCVNCGSITIDVDYDGRTQPGRVMRMISPRISKGAANAPVGT